MKFLHNGYTIGSFKADDIQKRRSDIELSRSYQISNSDTFWNGVFLV